MLPNVHFRRIKIINIFQSARHPQKVPIPVEAPWSPCNTRSRTNPTQLRTSSELAPNMFVASSEPASVMEFGFYTPCSDSRRTCLLNLRSALFTYFTKKMALRSLLMIALVLGARSSASIEVDTVSGSRMFYTRDSLLDWYMLWSGVCLSVCHKPVFYRNGWTDLVGVFWRMDFPRLILHCVVRKFGYV